MDLATHLHPMLVHFPIALIVAALIFSLGAWRTGSASWLIAARLALIGAAIGGALAAGAGYWAEEAGTHPESAHLLMDRHEDIGYWAAGLLVVLAAWGWKRTAKWISLPALVVTGLIFYQGYLGGQLVYVHGVGVAARRVFGSVPPDPDRDHEAGYTHRYIGRKGFGDGSISTH